MKLYITDKEFLAEDGKTIKYKQLYVSVTYNGNVITVPVKPVYKSDKGKLDLFAEKLESEEK